MYTADALISYAEQAGIRVSRRQIWEWKRDGLLPKPTRTVSTDQRRGGVPDRYPEPAPAAVVWLGTYRRKIDGIEVTKFWMWLDGVIDIRDIELETIVLDQCRRIWQRWQERLASLPDLDTLTSLTDEQQDAVLEEYGTTASKPAQAHRTKRPPPVGYTTVQIALLGLYYGDEDQLTDIVDPTILERMTARTHTNVPTVIRDINIRNIFQMVQHHLIDWNELRRSWQALHQQFGTEYLLTAFRFNIVGLVGMYWHARMNYLEEGFAFGIEVMEELLNDPDDDDDAEIVRQFFQSRLTKTAEHFRRHGFVATQRASIDTFVERLLEESEDS